MSARARVRTRLLPHAIQCNILLNVCDGLSVLPLPFVYEINCECVDFCWNSRFRDWIRGQLTLFGFRYSYIKACVQFKNCLKILPQLLFWWTQWSRSLLTSFLVYLDFIAISIDLSLSIRGFAGICVCFVVVAIVHTLGGWSAQHFESLLRSIVMHL